MAAVSNDNLLDLYFNPTYLFPIAGALLSGLTVYLLGFTKTSSTPPTIHLFANGKEKKTSVVGKKEKKRDANSSANGLSYTGASPGKLNKIQANGKVNGVNKVTAPVASTPVAAKKVKNTEIPQKTKSGASEKTKDIKEKSPSKKTKKNQIEKQHEVQDDVDQQMVHDTEDGEWQVVKTDARKKRKEKKDEPSKKEGAKKVESKKEGSKKNESKKDESKKVEPKKDEPKKAESKKDGLKKDSKKQ